MKKYCFGLHIVCMFLALCVLVVPVSAAEYDLFNTGRVTFTVDVPEDFEEIVFVSLMDEGGGVQQFPIVAEGDYRLVENVVCGPYRVSGFVDNDPWLEYTVLRDQEYITVTTDKDVALKLTVVNGGAGEIIEETAPTFPPETEDVTEPVLEEDPTEPVETAPSEAPVDGAGDESEEFEWPVWIKILFSVVISLGFVLLVIVIVRYIRNQM